jgi:hypothetical protein
MDRPEGIFNNDGSAGLVLSDTRVMGHKLVFVRFISPRRVPLQATEEAGSSTTLRFARHGKRM